MKHTLLPFTVLLAALGLAACNRPADSTQQADPGQDHDMGHMAQHATHGAQAAATAHSGTIAVTVGDQGFAPNRIALKQGEKSTLRFTRTSDKTCATEVVFPELGIKKSLPLDQPVDIDVPVDQARTLTFQCGMGMYRSQVVVSG